MRKNLISTLIVTSAFVFSWGMYSLKATQTTVHAVSCYFECCYENCNYNMNVNSNSNYNMNGNSNGNANINGITGSGSRGGASYHSECVDNQCKYVMGSGPNTCHRDEECIGTRNANVNTNVNMNRNMNSSTDTTNVNTNKNSLSETDRFTDIKGHKAEKAVGNLQNNCLAFGFEEGDSVLLKLDQNITRAELVVLLMRCKFGVLPAVSKTSFKDVPANHWAAQYLEKGKELEWISGYKGEGEAGMFKPNNSITREEAAKIILKAFFSDKDIIGLKSTKFKDVNLVQWYAVYVTDAERRNIMDELGDEFGVGKNMTRGAAVIIIDNLM